jgi:outer membrane receptor protein involved in Fe transport
LGSAPDDQFNTGIDTVNRLVGLYFSDTLSLTDRAHVTVSGRFNHASVEILDRLGVSLNGQHTFSRFNMGMGGVYEVSDAVSIFGRYSESNRAPTAAELSCADPAEPCRVPNAFVSDPPLEQVVAQAVEVGFRGPRLSNSRNGISWSVVFYRTAIGNDILFVASPELIGTGFFQNTGGTRRVGLDAELSGQVDRISWFASYGLVEATFQTNFELASDEEVNDAVDEDGMINVEVGDRMPGIPRQSLKAGFNYTMTDTWDVALDMIASSSRFYVGDEGNDQGALDGYGIANFRSVYRVSDNIEIFARIDNLFNNKYATFGVLAELEVFMSEVPDAQDPRFVSPGTSRSGFVGLRITL